VIEQFANRLVKNEGFRQALKSCVFWCDFYAFHRMHRNSEAYRQVLWYLTSHAERWV